MASLRKEGKNWYYRFVDENGKQRERKGCPDKKATEAMASAAETEATNIRQGFVDPKAIKYRDHEAKPLASHLTDWHAFLIGKESTPKHANLSRNRVGRVLDLGKAKRLSDLTPSRMQAALKAVRDDGVSLRSLHHYTRVLKGFSRWLWRDGRVREDNLAHLTSPNPDADRRHERRALDASEQARLIDAAALGGVVLKMTGPDRAMLYRIALGTGFRAGEIRSLTPRSFHLDDSTPTIIVAAAYSKRRRDDVQPIRPELAATLRPWLATRPSDAAIFPKMTSHTNLLIQADLEAAGILYRDASDQVADFHALRHSYVSTLVRSNASIKVVQTLARHSTPTLTLGVYSHVGLFDQIGALAGLPDLGTNPPTSEPLAATGTSGPICPQNSPLHFPYGGDGTGRNLSVPDDFASPTIIGEDWSESMPSTLRIQPIDGSCQLVSAPDENGGGGIRTPGTLAGSAVFKTAAIDHSATPPGVSTCIQLLTDFIQDILGDVDRHVDRYGDGDGVART